MPVCLPRRKYKMGRRITSSLSFLHSSNTRSGVEMDVSLDDQTILEQLSDVLAYIDSISQKYVSSPELSHSLHSGPTIFSSFHILEPKRPIASVALDLAFS